MLDERLRQMNAERVAELRSEAADLEAQAHALRVRADALARTWSLDAGDMVDKSGGPWDDVVTQG